MEGAVPAVLITLKQVRTQRLSLSELKFSRDQKIKTFDNKNGIIITAMKTAKSIVAFSSYTVCRDQY